MVTVFPNVSETFVVSNILQVLDQGKKVIILVQKKKSSKNSSQSELYKRYNLDEKVLEFREPKKSFQRYFKAIILLLNPLIFFYFIKCCIALQRISLEFIFKLNYYKPYRKANLFHIHFAFSGDLVPLLKKIGFIKSKIIVTFHGIDAFLREEKKYSNIKKRYDVIFETVNLITVNTPYLKEKVIGLGCSSNKIKIVPVGINLKLYAPKILPKILPDKTSIRLVSIGRLIELKGHEYGLRAVKILIDKGVNIHYSIIGTGNLFEYLRGLVNELELHNHVELLGACSQEFIIKELELSHVFLMLSITDSEGRAEAQGLVTAEAQAMGLPIVGFKSGGVPYAVSAKTSILVEEKNIKELSSAIIECVQNPERYSRMSLEANAWANNNFDVSKMVDAYYNI
ncbi:glycosyltransferase [Formosa undariae]|uniref:Glycosyltransferase n=1 Tax=Formosa undariae TaxID=1325436 RepID=A0ABV5F0B1_9FLAO